MFIDFIEDCDRGRIQCSDGSWCIEITWFCDGAADCNDGADEAHCDPGKYKV